jgi:hypothetical protein
MLNIASSCRSTAAVMNPSSSFASAAELDLVTLLRILVGALTGGQ